MISVTDFQYAAEGVPADAQLILIRTGYEVYCSEDNYWNDSLRISSEVVGNIRKTYTSVRVTWFDFISLTSPITEQKGGSAIKHCYALMKTSTRSWLLRICTWVYLTDYPKK